jgi:hypothetical protein
MLLLENPLKIDSEVEKTIDDVRIDQVEMQYLVQRRLQSHVDEYRDIRTSGRS